jgi:hypothetical protein
MESYVSRVIREMQGDTDTIRRMCQSEERDKYRPSSKTRLLTVPNMERTRQKIYVRSFVTSKIALVTRQRGVQTLPCGMASKEYMDRVTRDDDELTTTVSTGIPLRHTFSMSVRKGYAGLGAGLHVNVRITEQSTERSKRFIDDQQRRVKERKAPPIGESKTENTKIESDEGVGSLSHKSHLKFIKERENIQKVLQQRQVTLPPVITIQKEPLKTDVTEIMVHYRFPTKRVPPGKCRENSGHGNVPSRPTIPTRQQTLFDKRGKEINLDQYPVMPPVGAARRPKTRWEIPTAQSL